LNSNLILAQNTATLTSQDILDTISTLKTDNPSKTVAMYKGKISPPVTDKKSIDLILGTQPPKLAELRLHNPVIEEKIRELIKPVLELYGRKYEIIIIDHEMPYAMSDSGVLLVVSTGLFVQAESVDEVLGYIAHEVGHEYYLHYSVYAKYLLNLVESKEKEPALMRKFNEVLSLIELESDAFSAITVAHLGFDPTAFIAGFERVEGKYAAKGKPYHPSIAVRRQVVESVVPKEYIVPSKRKISPLLQEIKELLKPKIIVLEQVLR
jgi:Peptidase family M48